MHFLLLSILLCYTIVVHSQPRKVSAETTIQNVTVFSSGARVERTSSVLINAGRSEISFSGLSNQLDQQSVQLQADANLTLLSVQTTKDFLSERKIDLEERSFINQVSTLKDKINLDEKLLDVYKNEEAMLIKNQAIGGQAGVKTAELKVALDLQRQRLIEVYQNQLDVQKRIGVAKQEMDQLQAQLNEFSKKRDSVNFTITALVQSKETRTVKFQLFYNIKDAGWYATYDVRVKEVSEPLSVLMNANVFQRSGETWKDVSLLLSNGNPGDNATPTDLQPWMLNYYDPSISLRTQGARGSVSGRITSENGEPIPFATIEIKATNKAVASDINGFFKFENVNANTTLVVSAVGYEPKEIVAKPGYFTIALKQNSQHLSEVVVTGYGSLEGRAAGVNVSEDKNLKERKGSIQPVNVATEYQPTTTVYKIDDKYTLETDGKTTTIGIKQFTISAIYEYLTIPKIDPSAFLTAKIVNWQEYDLQSGEASLYFEGAYLGKTYIDLNSTEDTLSLSLGKDNSIKVTRKLIKEFSSKRFIGSNRTESKHYEISLRNTKRLTITIVVNDQLPVSVNKEIDVDDVKAPGAQLNKDTGIATWQVNLAPGEEKKLSISYSVKYPKDRRVVLE